MLLLGLALEKHLPGGVFWSGEGDEQIRSCRRANTPAPSISLRLRNRGANTRTGLPVAVWGIL